VSRNFGAFVTIYTDCDTPEKGQRDMDSPATQPKAVVVVTVVGIPVVAIRGAGVVIVVVP
jgi:hypothetical protein